MEMTDAKVTRLGKHILDKLKAHGEWATRSEIATLIGRPGNLTPHDVKVLKDLETMGLIEISEKQIGIVRTEYLYRVK